MDAKSVMTAVRLASQRDAAVTAKAEAAATLAGSNTAGISFEHSNVTDNHAYAIAYANGLWLAGMYNAAYYSADGKEWTKNENVTKTLGGFTYADGLWVAGGYAGGGIYYSEDGKTWTQSNVTNKQIRNIAYANGVWVAGGYASGLYYSEDGKNWTTSNVTSGTYNHIIYGDGLWIAGGTQLVYRSTDGKNWEQVALMLMKSLAYGDGVWVSYVSLFGRSPNLGLYYSNDGVNWTSLRLGGAFVAYVNGLWMCSGSSGLFYSYDGKSWTRTNIEKCTFNDISYGDGLWVAAADNANGTAGLYYSLDGKVWEQTNVAEGALAHVAYADGMWVAAADYGTGGSTGLYCGVIEKKYATPDDLANAVANIGNDLILKSTTEGSTKRFRLTVDDTGTIKAEEVTA